MEHWYRHMASCIFLKYGIKRELGMPRSSRRNEGLRQGKSSLLDSKNCFLILLSGIHRPHPDRFIRGGPIKRKKQSWRAWLNASESTRRYSSKIASQPRTAAGVPSNFSDSHCILVQGDFIRPWRVTQLNITPQSLAYFRPDVLKSHLTMLWGSLLVFPLKKKKNSCIPV